MKHTVPRRHNWPPVSCLDSSPCRSIPAEWAVECSAQLQANSRETTNQNLG